MASWEVFSVGVFQPCAAMPAKRSLPKAPDSAVAAVDTVAKAAKVSSVASSSLLAIAEDPLKTPGPEWPPSFQEIQTGLGFILA